MMSTLRLQNYTIIGQAYKVNQDSLSDPVSLSTFQGRAFMVSINHDLKEVIASFFNGTTFVHLQEIKDFAFGHDDDDHKYGQLQFLAMAL